MLPLNALVPLRPAPTTSRRRRGDGTSTGYTGVRHDPLGDPEAPGTVGLWVDTKSKEHVTDGASSRAERLAKSTYRQRLTPHARRRLWHLRQQVVSRINPPQRGKLSVVMPVYNVEAYLDEAVESVLSQSYQNLELILVDDGSTDSSGALCEQIAGRDKRVRVIHQTNAGLGAARNTGIAAARGKYLAFIDSDDYILPDAYAAMIEMQRRSGSDVVTGNVDAARGQARLPVLVAVAITSKRQCGPPARRYAGAAYGHGRMEQALRARFWRRYVKGFPVGKLYEDTATVFTALVHANSIDVVAAPVVCVATSRRRRIDHPAPVRAAQHRRPVRDDRQGRPR